ncbi:Sirohydrochlorin cobaltochelatase [Solibacillus isronensis B3W22]|uniref:Sirohydrochlorin cobaltochelatase n=1 Tax=Solibacillus isronensis B3W22 TaxID=1224748 RepID=K1KQN2_9BACL|nr:CbiX/SirB N-terminal domain-containing protein [Solibacillus isronensis]AMO85209.1 sirohydrochlorin cobaltochelatase [Solibacillus silvestris]EKB44786.1 Sirohydrochlorin cobaltochelatase [Solibacillus isronensis B3W22]
MTTWNLNQMQRHLLICNGATCMGAGAEEVTKQIRDEIRKNRLDEMIHTSRTRCNGRCKDKCVVIDYPKGTWYSVQDEETSRAIVQDTAEESSIIYSVEHGERIRHENRIKGIDKYKKGRGPLKKAVLFVGHGSRLEAGNEEVRQFVEQTKTYIDPALLVETCFLEFASPNIEDGIQLCVERGADEVHVIPIILLHAGHSKMHIPAEIEHAREHFPDVRFTYGQTIGIHEEIFEILKSRLTEVGFNPDEKHDDTAILLIARGGSDPYANGDFYKITRLLWEKLDVPIVESAFMGVTTPSVEQGIERCIRLGAKKIVMLPYFLFTGVLMERMAKMVQQFTEQYEDVDFLLANYFGYHPNLKKVLLERMDQALDGTSTGMIDLENFRKYAEEHGYEHHHHH